MIRTLSTILLSLTVASTGMAQATPTVTVSGRSQFEVPADRMSISLGVTETTKTVEEARERVDTVIASLVQLLDTLGLERDTEWKTGRYSIDPQWKPRPRNARAGATQEDWKPEIIGYTVKASISVTTGKIELAPKLIAGAAKAGANDIGSLHFSLADPRTSRSKAISQAAHNAHTDAHTLAVASGVVLTRILTLNLDNASANPPRPVEYKIATAMGRSLGMDAESLPEISGGMVTVTANVTAVWEIAPGSDDGHDGHTN